MLSQPHPAVADSAQRTDQNTVQAYAQFVSQQLWCAALLACTAQLLALPLPGRV